ncbi:MAG: hypothetical protein CBD76_00565 [Pelagibacteraceae bacterium TMED216]|nr:MAG: hypothetical protein CBD76_00565 [Pelagibacteraceae bacterium TMED216]|tara:strand:- start:102 stop:995 length:894 start_codon:yes stop_codon:yes gene_type:complete
MKKDQIVILEKRGVVLISGKDATEFLQNIITNDIKKVTEKNSIFSALLSPQGKYLTEFFIIKEKNGYLLDCNEDSTSDLLQSLSKYKLRSEVNFKNLSAEFVTGIINHEKFKELKIEIGSEDNTIYYRDTAVFSDPRNKKIGARIFSNLEKLYLTIKKLNLEIIDSLEYYSLTHRLGIPEKGIKNLKDKLFGLEANFEELQAIDFKKGCFVGQENTSRMKLKNKIRRKLLPITTSEELNIGDEVIYENNKVGTILIDKPYPFGLIKIFDPDLEEFENKELIANDKSCKILKSVKQSG